MAELTTEVAIGRLLDPKVYEQISDRALPRIAAFDAVDAEMLEYLFTEEELERLRHERRHRRAGN